MPTLEDLRKSAGLTQVQLAEAAGLSVSTVQKLEYGDFQPSWDTIIRLKDVLGDRVLIVEFKRNEPPKKRGRKPKSDERQEHLISWYKQKGTRSSDEGKD